MTRREAAERHGSAASSGGDSWKSTDTVKNVFAPQPARRGTPVRVATDKEKRYVGACCDHPLPLWATMPLFGSSDG
jgi:hypothetical protein